MLSSCGHRISGIARTGIRTVTDVRERRLASKVEGFASATGGAPVRTRAQIGMATQVPSCGPTEMPT